MQFHSVDWTKTLDIRGATWLVRFNFISIPIHFRRAPSERFAGIANTLVMHWE